jgi:nucleotide-binding universal stress UspA family protein
MELIMPQPILVPLDGSDLAEQALPYAEALARSKCELILLEVGDDPNDEFRLLGRHGDSCARLETVVGDPAGQILEVAEELGAGTIVMTTHGRGAIGRWALGSVADAVSRRSSIPVMLIRPDEENPQVIAPPIKRLVVPLEGSDRAEQALPTAAALAEQLQVPVHLITVVGSTNGVSLRIATAAVDAVLLQECLDESRAEAEALLAGYADRLRSEGITCSWEVLHGSPYFSIADAVHEGDVIVMASHGREGVARWLVGSVAEKLVREGPVPVILVPSSDEPAGSQLGHAPATADKLVTS